MATESDVLCLVIHRKMTLMRLRFRAQALKDPPLCSSTVLAASQHRYLYGLHNIRKPPCIQYTTASVLHFREGKGGQQHPAATALRETGSYMKTTLQQLKNYILFYLEFVEQKLKISISCSAYLN
jgi:hypothetical protein